MCFIQRTKKKKYINNYYWQKPNMVKLIALVGLENETTLKRLGMNLEKVFKLRHDYLYSPLLVIVLRLI